MKIDSEAGTMIMILCGLMIAALLALTVIAAIISKLVTRKLSPKTTIQQNREAMHKFQEDVNRICADNIHKWYESRDPQSWPEDKNLYCCKEKTHLDRK